MTLRPESIGKPELSQNELALKQASAAFTNVKPAFLKSSVYDVPEQYQIPDMSEDLQKILENESENYKDQVQSFVDLCETLSKPGWQFADIVDYIHMLVRSVNLDALSVVLTEPSEKGKFCKLISRGYKSAPGPKIVEEWQPAITEDATVDWNKLMDIAADKNTKLCRWISKEGLHSVGYVPLHDSSKIYGFLLVGAYENKIQAPLASSLLELCGDRIGLILESRRRISAIPSTAIGTVKIMQDQLTLLASYLEALKLSAKLSPEDVAATSEKCLKALSECKKLVDSFADDLSSSQTSGKNA
jgi:transcriptional regulator with GAF, ATPase, and Fis domain